MNEEACGRMKETSYLYVKGGQVAVHSDLFLWVWREIGSTGIPYARAIQGDSLHSILLL